MTPNRQAMLEKFMQDFAGQLASGRGVAPPTVPTPPNAPPSPMGAPQSGVGPLMAQNATLAPAAMAPRGAPAPATGRPPSASKVPYGYASKENTEQVQQQAYAGLQKGLQGILARQRSKKVKQAELVATALLTGQADEKTQAQLESKAKKIKEILDAMNSGDAEKIAKYAASPEMEGVQAAVTRVVQQQHEQQARQMAQQQHELGVRQALDENARLKTQHEADKLELQRLQTQQVAGTPVKMLKTLPDGTQKVVMMQADAETGVYDKEIGEAVPDSGASEPWQNLEVTIDGKPALVKFNQELGRYVDGQGNDVTAKVKPKAANQTDSDIYTELYIKNEMGTATPDDKLRFEALRDKMTYSAQSAFDRRNPEVPKEQVNYIVDQILRPGGETSVSRLVGGNSTLLGQVRSELAARGIDLQDLTAASRSLGEVSKQLVPKIREGVAFLEKPGMAEKLGPFMGRWQDFLYTGYGSGADPDVAAFKTVASLISTGAMRAHVGARGGQALTERFDKMVNAKNMDVPTLKASMSALADFLQGYVDMLTRDTGRPNGVRAAENQPPASDPVADAIKQLAAPQR